MESDNEHRFSRYAHATEEQDEGRYDINRRQPPQKRRKIGKPKDSHTVFTTDDDDEFERNSVRVEAEGADSLDEEEAHYASYDEVETRGTERTEKRRSYWLSKALDIGGSALDM